MTCAKMSKVPKSARCRKIGTREMTGMERPSPATAAQGDSQHTAHAALAR